MAEVLSLRQGPMPLPGAADFKRCLLHDYLFAIKDLDFRWGVMDCACAAAGWLSRLHGIDAAKIIPVYACEDEARMILRAGGGLAAMAHEAMAGFGFALTREPEDGDLGLIKPRRPDITVAGGGGLAISVGGLWVTKIDRGLLGQRGPALWAWRL